MERTIKHINKNKTIITENMNTPLAAFIWYLYTIQWPDNSNPKDGK